MHTEPQIHQSDERLAHSMRITLSAFLFVSISLLVLTWVYLSSAGSVSAGRDVSIPSAAATDVRGS